MRLWLLPEIVSTERRVSEVVRQRIPGHRTGDGERPTAEHAATIRQDGGGWKIEVADDWQRPMWGGSSSRGPTSIIAIKCHYVPCGLVVWYM